MFKTHPVDLYDFVYSWKNYANESRTIRQLMGQYGFCAGQSVLELACGTGRYLEHFDDCRQFGIDLCERSLSIASQRIPRGTFYCADMADFKVPERVDMILCLFGAYGYLLTDGAQANCIRCIYNALKPGGLLVLQPWVEPNSFIDGQTYLQTYRSPNLMVSRMVTPMRKQDLSVLDFQFLVSRSGYKTERLTSLDLLRMTEHRKVLADLESLDFEALAEKQFLSSDRPLYVMRRTA